MSLYLDAVNSWCGKARFSHQFVPQSFLAVTSMAVHHRAAIQETNSEHRQVKYLVLNARNHWPPRERYNWSPNVDFLCPYSMPVCTAILVISRHSVRKGVAASAKKVNTRRNKGIVTFKNQWWREIDQSRRGKAERGYVMPIRHSGGQC